MNDDVKIALVNALVSRYQAKLQNAKANLLVYLNSPVGVGEHSYLTEECAKLVEEMDHANSVLGLLNSMFTAPQGVPQE